MDGKSHLDVLSVWSFYPLGRHVLGTSCPLDVMSDGTLCLLGRFVLWTSCPVDVLSVGRHVRGRYVCGRLVGGHFVCGRCVGGRFVIVPFLSFKKMGTDGPSPKKMGSFSHKWVGDVSTRDFSS